MNNSLKLFLLDRQNLALKAENKKLKANLDYLSMMTDVEIPTEDEDNGTQQEI